MPEKKEKAAKNRFEKLIRDVISGDDIDTGLLSAVFKELLEHSLGESNETSLGALFASLQTRGVKDEEIVALFNVVQDYDRIPAACSYDPCSLYGIVGSGKDEFKTYNVSTCAAFVAATMGIKVVKNGSRSDTSMAGTTDLLEALGYPVDAANHNHDSSIKAANIAFSDALPHFPLMSREYVGKILFLNPLSYVLSIASGIEFKNIVFGVSFDETERVCKLLRMIGMRSALVVAGKTDDGRHFDEISTVGPTKISELRNGQIRTYEVSPEELGLRKSSPISIAQPSSLDEAKKLFLEVITGRAKHETSSIVAANAGALYFLEHGPDASDLRSSIAKAQGVIDSGSTFETFKKFMDSAGRASTGDKG